MKVATTSRELSESGGEGCVLVPTMGALHRGHLDLVAAARLRAGPGGVVAVSVFVNPTQFNEAADFARYPRTLESDLDACREAGVDLVFAPEPEAMYPPGVEVPVGELPEVATRPGLEDAFRPGHFAGVCQVVRRLFVLTRASAAVFGEKDWQQLQVVRAMTAGERLGVEIVPVATAREADGLAMSSRNRLLGPGDRGAAISLSRALAAGASEGSAGEAERQMRSVLAEAGAATEYAVVRDAETLLAPRPGRPARALVAARVGAVRLLDNAAWPVG